MFPALKRSNHNERIIPIFVFLFIILNTFFRFTNTQIVFAQEEDGPRCVCVDPITDGCACLETNTNPRPGIDEEVETSLGEVRVRCANAQLASSFFNVSNPVCGNNAEVLPYCSRVSWLDLGAAICWGTSFASDPNNAPDIPDGTGGTFESFTATPLYYQGWVGNVDKLLTCSSGLYCCGALDRDGNSYCVEESPIYGTCPASSDGPIAGTIADEICRIRLEPFYGQAESRLWFPHARLVHILSTMAQTMFNPKSSEPYEDEDYFLMYEDTAFSKTSTQAERDSGDSGDFDFGNKGGITARIEKHQGRGTDSTRTFGDPNNNSSAIVDQLVPDPLTPFYQQFPGADKACYMSKTFSNPGDDLMGAKIRAEMLFTKDFTIQVKGTPEGCVEDGGTFQILYSDRVAYENGTLLVEDPNTGDYVPACLLDCCSAICDVQEWEMYGCTQYPVQQTAEECAATDSTRPEPCSYDQNEDSTPEYYCCESVDEPEAPDLCEPPSTVDVVCGWQPFLTEPVEGDAIIYNKTPLIEAINDTILAGKDSLFRRFMPNIPGMFDYDQIPSKTSFLATVNVIDFRETLEHWSADNGSFNLEFAKGQLFSPEMYIPHLGSLYKYWLVDFQTALRPYSSSRPSIYYDDPDGLMPNPDYDLPDVPYTDTSECTPGPEPYSSELDAVIGEAIRRYGSDSATANVPPGVLRAVYFIESYGQWNDPNYTCQYNSLGDAFGILGLMQIGNTAYRTAVPESQRLSDDRGHCEYTLGKMSRCNPVDAIEIGARVLLYKVGLFNYSSFTALGPMTSLPQVYCSSAGYYGSTEPDTATDARARNLDVPPGVEAPCNYGGGICNTNYSEVVCYDSGFCASSNEYPDPRPPAAYCLSNFP